MNDIIASAGVSTAPLVWVDLEMTGLDPKVDEIVEVAVIVTDANLRPLEPGIELVVCPSDASLQQMDSFVTQMHEKSGLISKIQRGVSVEEAEKTVLDYVSALVPEPGVALIAGNTIGQDQRFLRKYMPSLMDHLHYRAVDVSTVKELAKRWYPIVYENAPGKDGSHRALSDIQDSIVELEYYRRALFPVEMNADADFYRCLANKVESDGTFFGCQQN